jgi:hypothetical protein
MKKIKNKKVKEADVGRFVRVEFDDVGAVDGVITQVDGPHDFHFLPLGDVTPSVTHNNASRVISLGNHITAENSGL